MSVPPEVQEVIESRQSWMQMALAEKRKFNALKHRATLALANVEAAALTHGVDNVWLFERINQEYNAIQDFSGESNA